MIDERAIINANAKIADNVEIGPWSIIGPDVEIGENCWIGPHVVIKGPTKIGKNNKIYQFSSIGEAPQAKVYAGEDTLLEIGDNNLIREFVTLNRGTAQGRGVTRIGSHNFIMAYVHIAHDCIVGDNIVFSNNAALSGHVVVGDHVVFGGFSAVHQFCNIGSYCFISGETSVAKDVPPFVLVSGHPGAVYGLNVVGLKRHEFSDDTMATLRRAYNIIYRKGLTIPQALNELEPMISETPNVQLLIDALNNSSRGIVR